MYIYIEDSLDITSVHSNFSSQVTTMSGTRVTITLGQVYDFFGINSFVIKASGLDKSNSEGLCGTVNGKDLMPQNGITPFAKNATMEPLATSWRYIYIYIYTSEN